MLKAGAERPCGAKPFIFRKPLTSNKILCSFKVNNIFLEWNLHGWGKRHHCLTGIMCLQEKVTKYKLGSQQLPNTGRISKGRITLKRWRLGKFAAESRSTKMVAVCYRTFTVHCGFSTTRVHFCLAPPALQAFKAFVAEVKAEDCSFYRKNTKKRPRLSFKWQHNLLSLHICLKSRRRGKCAVGRVICNEFCSEWRWW